MSARGRRNGDITEIQGISARKIGQDQGRHVKKIQNHNSLHSAEVFHKQGYCSIYVKKKYDSSIFSQLSCNTGS